MKKKEEDEKDNQDKVDTLINALTQRDPSKRRVKPVESDMLQLFEDMDDDSDSEYVADESGEEDEDDDDHNAKDSGEESDDDDDDSDSSEEDKLKNLRSKPPVTQVNGFDSAATAPAKEGDDSENRARPPERSCVADKKPVTTRQESPKGHAVHKRPIEDVLICLLCLGEDSVKDNELIECDACGIVVHENCYGIPDNVSISSSGSSESTEPWFCEACLAQVKNPLCELCPFIGGVFKRTDDNRWVHLLCALYTPGVAFNDVDSLTEVTLTELPPRDWSLRECSLCEDRLYAWTGVCISCDAGLCRNFFHVTCAQKDGLLSEPSHDENSADPYFAQCRQHTDKTVAKQRRRNLLTALSRHRNKQRELGSGGPNKRIGRKLDTTRVKYLKWQNEKPIPYAPEHKTPRFLETSPVSLHLFLKKATNLGLPTQLVGSRQASEAQKTGPTGFPVFSSDFVTYVLDREKRIDSYSVRVSELEHSQRDLQITDGNASHNYNRAANRAEEVRERLKELKGTTSKLWDMITYLSPSLDIPEKTAALLKTEEEEPAPLVAPDDGSEIKAATNQRPRPRARVLGSARNSGVQLDLMVNGEASETGDSRNGKTVINECAICRGLHDQHLLVLCDWCKKSFHLACLEPPLTRMPKKTRLYGWECSWCTKAKTSDSDTVVVDVDAPRQLRRPVAPVPSGDGVQQGTEAKQTQPTRKRRRVLSINKGAHGIGAKRRRITSGGRRSRHALPLRRTKRRPCPPPARYLDMSTVTTGPGVVNSGGLDLAVTPTVSPPAAPLVANLNMRKITIKCYNSKSGSGPSSTTTSPEKRPQGDALEGVEEEDPEYDEESMTSQSDTEEDEKLEYEEDDDSDDEDDTEEQENKVTSIVSSPTKAPPVTPSKDEVPDNADSPMKRQYVICGDQNDNDLPSPKRKTPTGSFTVKLIKFE